MNPDVLESKLEYLEHIIKDQQAQIKELNSRLQLQEDIRALYTLQRKYGYFVQHVLRDEIVDCFANRPDVRLNWIEGVWKGIAGVKRYFREDVTPPPGFLHQVMQIQGVITVAPDGLTAKGRWCAFGGINIPFDGQWRKSFASGTYEMGYIKEHGVWKILTIDWIVNYSVKIPAEAWESQEDTGRAVINPNFQPPEADIPGDADDPRFKSGYVFPFHFTHPVTGKPTTETKRNTPFLKK